MKGQLVGSYNDTAKGNNFAYKYEDSNHPTVPTQIGHDHYAYDANGNPTLVTNDSTNTTREMYWDEDNRLMVLSDNGKTSRYTYNAAGERIMKSYGTMGALRSIDYNKYFVIGLVHEEGGHITDGLYPNHYVQLLGFNRQNYASFWTWGEAIPRKSHVFGLMHGIHQIYMIKR